MKLAGAAAKKFIAKPDPAARAALVYGPNRSLVAEACDEIVAGLLGKDADDFSLTRLEESDVRKDKALLGDELAAQSMFGGTRVIRLRADGDSAHETITAALGDLEAGGPAAAFLVVEGGDLKGASKIRAAFEKAKAAPAIVFYEDDAESLAALAKSSLAEQRVKLTPEAEAILESSLPSDRALLRGEIEKLALFAHGRNEPVGADAVAALLAVEAEAALDEATGAATAGNAARAVEALEQGDAAAISAIRALERRLLRLMEARTMVDAGASPADAASKLRPPVFWKERDAFAAQIRRWPLGALAAALDVLWKAQVRAMTAGAPQELIAAEAFKAVAGLVRK